MTPPRGSKKRARWRKWISPIIGPKPIATITTDDVENVRDALAEDLDGDLGAPLAPLPAKLVTGSVVGISVIPSTSADTLDGAALVGHETEGSLVGLDDHEETLTPSAAKLECSRMPPGHATPPAPIERDRSQVCLGDARERRTTPRTRIEARG